MNSDEESQRNREDEGNPPTDSLEHARDPPAQDAERTSPPRAGDTSDESPDGSDSGRAGGAGESSAPNAAGRPGSPNGAGHHRDDSRNQSEGTERAADEAFCSSCGELIKVEAEICPHCGVRQRTETSGLGASPGNLDPALSGVASFLLPGLGQAYNGQIPRGIAVFLAVMMADLIIITVSFIFTFIVIGIFGFFLVPVVHLLAAADAHSQAGKINRGEVAVQ